MFQKREVVLQIFLLEYINHAYWSMTCNGEPLLPYQRHFNSQDRRWHQNKKYPADRSKLL